MVYAAAGGVRERARQTECISNLSQIGKAYHMYFADYDIEDNPLLIGRMAANNESGIFSVYKDYLKDNGKIRCRSNIEFPGSNGYSGAHHAEPRRDASQLGFVEVYGQCRERTALLYDVNHNFFDPDLPRPIVMNLFVLRLNGSVTKQRARRTIRHDNLCFDDVR